jgi:hypothetical protein
VPLDVRIGDVVRLRKPHPCGGYDWTVVRLGADIGLRCSVCQRRILLPRSELERRLRSFVTRVERKDPFGAPEPLPAVGGLLQDGQ